MSPTACRVLVSAGLALVLAAPARAGGDPIFVDGFESGGTCEWSLGTTACPGFEIFVPEVTAQPGEEIEWCYFFRTGNAAAVGARLFESRMTGLAMRLDVYTTHDGTGPIEMQPPGTLLSGACLSGGGVSFRRIFTAQEDELAVDFPLDDGDGQPVALGLEAQQPAVLVTHLLNGSAQAASTSAVFRVHTLAVGTAFTPSHTFTTVNSVISIPPGAVGSEQSQTCPVPGGASFWWFSTLTHERAMSATLENGGSPIVVSSDWDAPAVTAFLAAPFYEFGVGEELTYKCSYDNPGGGPIFAGPSYATDEACWALGYFFPATVPRLCLNDILVP